MARLFDTFGAAPAPQFAWVTDAQPLDFDQVIEIVGRGFFAISSVTFAGSAEAVFEVVSDALIRATVPLNAHNGKITIVGQYGTVQSQALTINGAAVEYVYFRHTMAEAASDFVVPLPSELESSAYSVLMSVSKAGAGVVFEPLDADRTETQFRALASAPLAAGDEIDILVVS